MLARSQPFCTKVSIPSGRTSDTVTWRSASGTDARIHACNAPAPTTAVSARSGTVVYTPAVPAGGGCQRYVGVARHRPPAPVSPVKLVTGRASGFQVNASDPDAPGRASASAPPADRYHERAR